jgi:hypothetical protein
MTINTPSEDWEYFFMEKCEVCETEAYLDTHHINSTSLAGVNDSYNLARVCPNCHRKIHKGEIILEGKFLTTEGYKIIFHTKGSESVTGREPEVFIMGKK